MQDVLLTVPDLYFCYEVAKAARRAWATLATRNLHEVGRFNSLNSPAPPPLPTVFLSNRKLPQNVLRLHGSLVRRWRGFNSLKLPRPPPVPTVFLSNRKLPQNVLRLHGSLVRSWRGFHTVAQISENPSSTSWCFGHSCRRKAAGKAGGGNGNVWRWPFPRD